ncbi:MAG: pyruvate formate lyase-activating protein [Lachnospiraceae bacterium]|nr:pyruvate formate lyase-activating protein [Lachnospiraceae bacterium]
MGIKGYVHSFESFALVDGPGVRYCVFLQGCKMRCKYCHNPETWECGCGEEWSATDLFNKIYRYKTYWKNNGGITVSGGEALLQMEFVTELFSIAKEKGVNTCLDTSGYSFSMDSEYLEKFDKLMEVTDLFLLDIKEMDEEKHKKLTGCSNEGILAMAKYLSDNGKAMWIRHVLVPELTDDETGLKDLADFISTLKTVERVEILPYHTLGTFKWEKLGIKYPLEGYRVPTEDEVEKAEKILGIEKKK